MRRMTFEGALARLCIVPRAYVPGTVTYPGQHVRQVLRPDERLFHLFPATDRYRGGYAEQTAGTRRRRPSPSRRFEKNRANRLRRRAEVRDPENAPTRVVRGWHD